MPVNALSAGETYTEQQTLDDLNTENSNSTNESNATSTEVATDSNASEEESISEISSNDIDSSEEKLNNNISLQSDNTEDEEEPSTDNWELGLVFYDSTVDNGKTPLTSIDWDASDGGYGDGTPRVITLQVNYKNTNAVTTYQPNELEIDLARLFKTTKYNFNWGADNVTWFTVDMLVGANDTTHTGYDWNLVNTNENSFIFKNANIIEETSNFEGSIRVVYTITPKGHSPEAGKDECTQKDSKQVQAVLKNLTESNEVSFSYERKIYHPWKKDTYWIKKEAYKIKSYDNLGQDASNYIWVQYHFTYRFSASGWSSSYYCYPYIHAKGLEIRDNLPEECVVYSSTGMKYTSVDGTYVFPARDSGGTGNDKTIIYVGYPRDIYKEENMHVENTAELWGTYINETEQEKLATGSVSVNLNDFEFIYEPTGEYAIKKDAGTGSYNYKFYYQDIINDWNQNNSNWHITPTAYYTGEPMTLKIGDDILYCTTDNDIQKLQDDDYYFTRISTHDAYNANGNKIGKYKYDCELWVRHKDETKYVLYDSFKNGGGGKRSDYYTEGIGWWDFTKEDAIVGFYFIYHDLEESFIGKTHTDAGVTDYDTPITANIKFTKKDIPESGTLYNFDYFQVYFKDSEGNLVLQNEPEINSYSNFITKEEIAEFDQETYGTYMQRAVASKNWSYYNVPQPSASLSTIKNFGSITQDATNEQFLGSCTIGAKLRGGGEVQTNYLEEYDPEYGFQGFRLYDLLPYGMELTSTKEEIIKSFVASAGFAYIYDTEGNQLLYNSWDSSIKNIIDVENIDVIITKNWNNTGRTRIEIGMKLKKPLFFFGYSGYWDRHNVTFSYTYNFSISYDAFMEVGNVWTNYCYGDKLEIQEKGISIYGVSDNGTYDKDASDINENGNTSERLAYIKADTTITSIVSTHQDVTKYVQTDKSNYSTGTVKASPDSEYTYKLRVRTGQNDVTNLVIYDSVEEYAQDKDGNIVPAYGTKKHWNGEFLGVDTSYAEKKGYKVKVYYSEDKQAGNLSADNSWKEYSDAVDKTSVKSLAFEYLDENGNPAIVPLGSMTYVLVKMKAPSEENRKILAYNGCRTQWNAIDQFDNPVDFITGINSNIVKVSLSDYYDLTVNKVWNDENNKWGLRPDSVDIILKKDGVEVERKQITKDNLSVTFTDLLVEDSDRYTIEEESLSLYFSTIEYNELEDCYEVTNTLKDDIFTDISGTKTWVGDKESKRPESITINLLKDGKIYKTTTTNAEKEWKYIFSKVPIYNADGTECVYSVEEVPVDRYSVQYTTPSNGLAIKFNSQCRTESVNYDYVEIYYKQDGQTFKLGKWGGTTLAGQTVNVPTKDFYLYWRTDSSNCSYYGFGIDSIESVDVNVTGTIATLPNYTATELTGTDYPESPNHGNYGNNVNMLWHYTGEPDNEYNIINTYEGVDAVNLSFVKAIEGTDEAFEKLQLNKDALYKFQISMEDTETGDTISVPIDNKNTVTVNEVPVGTYVITEKDDMYFDFVSMETLNSVEGVTFEKVEGDYVLTITDTAMDEETLQIKVNNKIEPDRPYEDKKERVNLFDWTSGGDSEEASLLSRIANFFKN